MRRLSWIFPAAGIVLAAGLPVAGLAQDAVIRIEAKRGEAAAQAAAEKWRAGFENVVTFPLSGGWTGIALGPLSPDEAEAKMRELKAAGSIPRDSFVAVPGGNVVLSPVGAEPATSMTQDTSEPEPEAAPEEVTIKADPPAGTFIRLQSLQSQSEAETRLASWREQFPDAGLWHLANGWYAIALGPLEQPTAAAWLRAFKAGGTLPKDAFTSEAVDMGEAIEAGVAPDWPAPGEARPMPPLDEVQRALRWAGHYDGEIDGKSGPKTQAAIAAEVAALRLSPDPGTAMQKLIERRAAWRDEMGLTTLEDAHTGLSVVAPMDKLQFDRAERALSIYAPKADSGAALILFSQPGGQQELLDLSGLVTALGWVPRPDRQIERGHVLLEGENSDHHGRAEGWVRDGRAEGFVLIWPAGDAENRTRIAAEMSDSLSRFADAENDPQQQPVDP